MDPISILLLGGLVIGLAFLSGCNNYEEVNKEADNPENPTIDEEETEKTLDNGNNDTDTSWIVSGASVVCTNAIEIKSNSKVMKDSEPNGAITQKEEELCQLDSKIEPLFSKCSDIDDGICIYDSEQEIWNDYSKNKVLGREKYGLLKDRAYIVCANGGGLIFATDDGQIIGDSGREVALNIIKKWIDNPGNISDKLLQEAGILASQNGANYFEAIGYQFDPNFSTYGMKVLKDLELDLSYAAKKGYIVQDANGNISVYPYYVGDGVITFGYGVAISKDSLDPAKEKLLFQMCQYYYTVYTPGAQFNGTANTAIISNNIPAIPLDELDAMFEYVIREKYQEGIENFVNNNGLTVNQNEYDALVAMKFNMGYIPEKILDAIVDSKQNNLSDTDARNKIRQACYQHYSSLNNASTYLNGWMNRVDETLDLYFK